MKINLAKIDFGPTGGGGVQPTGTTYITQNGVYDVTSYASADVSIAEEKPETTFSVSPSTDIQQVTPPTGYVFSGGEVSAVTSAIDANITAGNIKKDVEILGVTGTYEGQQVSGTLAVTQDGVYDVVSYASVSVSVSGDYRNQKGTISGLEDLGWDAESRAYANANLLHYDWENSAYTVTSENKALYGVVNFSNRNSYSENPDMVYVPYFEIPTGTTYLGSFLRSFKYIKAIPKFDLSNKTSLYYGFSENTSLETIPPLDTSSVASMEGMFYRCTSLKSIPLLNTSNVTNMVHMFRECNSLEIIPLLDTSNVTNMQGMFDRCKSLKVIPLLNTGNVTNMGSMFYECNSLKTIPALDTSKVTDMTQMFGYCSSLQEINGIDFSSLTSMPNYFLQGAGPSITRFIVNGKIDFSWNGVNGGLERLENIDYESVKSILQAMYRTTNTDAKVMRLSVLVSDPQGEIAQLISDCATKGWTVQGLIIPTGDPVIHYTSKDGNVVNINTSYKPSDVTVISNVYDNGLGTITFSKHITQIWQNMFNRATQLDTIEIPDEVNLLEYACFADGCGISRITIPANVTNMRAYVFSGAMDLLEVVMESSTPPAATNGIFNAHNANLVIKVPAGSLSAYQSATNWSPYASLMVEY